MNKYWFFLALVFFASGNNLKAQQTINVADYGVNDQSTDCTPGVINSLMACKKAGNAVLKFNKGVYHFYSYFGTDKYKFFSNNDEGLKRIVFLLEDMKNLTIDGQGSAFIFHGFINPFVVNNSKNITFKNFSIDFARSFHSEATIIANNEDGIDVEIPENFPYVINNGILVFNDGVKSQGQKTTVSKETIFDYDHLLEFDTKRRETAFMAKDYYLGKPFLPAKSIGDRKVRIFLKNLKGTVGNTMVFGYAHRYFPGFSVDKCKNIRFENITIYHAGGMGIICQRSQNISVISCKVTPSKGRIVSTTADATHFSNCSGKIEMAHCVFENQLDDATNIHGLYVQIAKKIGPKEYIVQLKHHQQLGFDFLEKGATIEFVQGKSMITKGQAKVLKSTRINKNFRQLKLSTELPDGINIGDVIGEVYSYQLVHIHNNYIGKNRARGLLLGCKGKIIVENNKFHTPGAALLFGGESVYWFEQGAVSDCTIQNNVFENCLYGVWGKAIVDVGAGVKENKELSRYNKNIKVLNNTFQVFDQSLLLNLYCVDGMLWKGNKIEKTTEYPATRFSEILFKVENSDNINIEQETGKTKYVYSK